MLQPTVVAKVLAESLDSPIQGLRVHASAPLEMNSVAEHFVDHGMPRLAGVEGGVGILDGVELVRISSRINMSDVAWQELHEVVQGEQNLGREHINFIDAQESIGSPEETLLHNGRRRIFLALDFDHIGEMIGLGDHV